VRNAEGDDSTAAFGTPGFMAPEQERDGVVTVRSDIFGLGRTLKVALFPSDSANQASNAHVNEVAKSLWELLASMTHLDPARRPQSMRIVADRLSSLAEWLARGPASSSAPSTIGRELPPPTAEPERAETVAQGRVGRGTEATPATAERVDSAGSKVP